MAWWAGEFARCTRCYACRQVCPMCYCERCVADKNRPVIIDTSPTPLGNFAWHITRAFHLAGRCVGCGACNQACPVGIDLRLMNMAVHRAVDQNFGFNPGADPTSESPIGSWKPADHEEFIR
jgi:ferredoxin